MKTTRLIPGLAALAGLTLLTACGSPMGDDGPDDDDATGDGVLAGDVWIGGPVAGATVTVTQLDPDSTDGAIKAEAGTTTTDAAGHYELAIGELNGLFVVEARGGSYTELASGETIELDAEAAIRSLHHVELFEGRRDALVSPVGHLTEAMARGYLADHRATTFDDAIAAVKPHLDDHFGNVDWERLSPASLATAAASLTSEVRAALVIGAWSLLGVDLAAASGELPQDVNSYALMLGWAEDLADGPFDGTLAAGSAGAFDGNDGNAQGGLSVGSCEPPSGTCTQACGCYALCDLYDGTPRAVLAAELTKLAGAAANQTGLDADAIEPIAAAIRLAEDALLFGATCDQPDDVLPPTIAFAATTPAEGALVRGTIEVSATAIDDHDATPTLVFATPFVDGDGDATNAVARVVIDTAAGDDGMISVTAVATDDDGHTAMATRSFEADNTAPELGLDDDGFLVRAGEWWTTALDPVVKGHVTDAHTITVRAMAGATEIGAITTTAGAFELALTAGSIAANGTDVTFIATDAAGNAAQTIQRLRVDAAPATLTVNASPIKSETADVVTFPTDTYEYSIDHVHAGAVIDLAASTPTSVCPTVYKYVHLLAASTPYTTESAGRNPIQFNLTAVDDGIGLDLARSEYRVTHQATGTVVQDWTANGAGTVAGDATSYAIRLDTSLTQLRTTEGIYVVDLRVRDQFGRTTQTSRCWDHRLLAPPLKTSGARSMTSGMSKLALTSLTFGTPSSTQTDDFAAKLMNLSSKGASVSELDVSVGTELPTYLTVTLTPSSLIDVAQQFTIRQRMTNLTTTNTSCPEDGCVVYNTPADYTSPATALAPTIPAMKIRVYALSSTGVIGAELAPCTAAQGCATSGTTYEFLLAGRDTSASHNQPPKRYLVATLTGPLTDLAPVNSSQPFSGDYVDTEIAAIRFTGWRGVNTWRCLAVTTVVIGGEPEQVCDRSAYLQPYRASTQLQVSLTGSPARTEYATAVSAALAPRSLTTTVAGTSWSATETTLP